MRESDSVTTAGWTRRAFLSASFLAASGLFARAQAASAGAGPGRLALYHTHTREAATVVYRDAAGRYDPTALHRLNRLLRCHFTGEEVPIDLRVIEFLRAVDQGLGGDREIHVISGFRSATYNRWLVRHRSGVAARSLHLEGRAIDVRFPGLPLRQVRQAALALGRGGVGYYPASGFVHLDSGRRRSW
jgi:uncharacterized protein YcbK (DUF882 family)